MSESNKRDSSRIGLVIDIKIIHDDKTEHILKSRNISDHGVFLEYGNSSLRLSIGTHVVLQVCSMLDDSPPPPVNAEVTRTTEDGMGLQFIL